MTMHSVLAVAIALLALGAVAKADSPPSTAMDWRPWQRLPVQDNGRHKPLDTLAWETGRLIANRTSWIDPGTGQRLDGVAWYLAMIFDWQGKDVPADDGDMMGNNPTTQYFAAHEPDRWDREALIFVNSPELRRSLGMPHDKRYISPLDLSRATIRVSSGRETLFPLWAEGLAGAKQHRRLTAMEKEGMEVADRLWFYHAVRMGKRLELVPLADSSLDEWVSVAKLQADAGQRSPAMKRLKERYQHVVSAYRARNAQEFNTASAELIADLRDTGPTLGHYPDQKWIDMEVTYNHWTPFRFAWVLALAACAGGLLSMGSGWRVFYGGAIGAFAASLAAMVVGFWMRSAISGRAPVTNMYESVTYVGAGVAALGLIFELAYRRRFILVAAAAVATVALILADNCPAILDPSLRPLQPVLRSNFWLTTHVMTITGSYAAFALALGIADVALGYFLVRSPKRDVIAGLTKFIYHSVQVGIFLLAVGIILGGVWARYSWGRFWGWDPKEVWALVALLGYLAVLHARHVGWVGDLGLSVLSVLCFLLVVMAWYGVNFVLGSGLHSYGFGSGASHAYVAGALIVQFLYVGLAILRAPRLTERL